MKFVKLNNSKPCPDCGKLIRLYSTYCKSCAAKGIRNGFYGKKHDPAVMKLAGIKSGITRLGKKNNKRWSIESRERQSKRLKGQRHSIATEFKKGGISPNYKGGITPLNKWIRSTEKNKAWIKSVLKRDNFTCKECGLRGVALEAHHINRFSNILKDFLISYSQFSPLEDTETLVRLSETYAPFFDINNGITLCVDCHAKTKGRVFCCSENYNQSLQ